MMQITTNVCGALMELKKKVLEVRDACLLLRTSSATYPFHDLESYELRVSVFQLISGVTNTCLIEQL